MPTEAVLDTRPAAAPSALASRNERARRRGDKPDWEREGADWPNRAASRFVHAGGYRWHVQTAGHGPVLLLVHGTGASTHSWRDLIPSLAQHFTVVAPDLPGHGFTDTPGFAGLSLPGMALGLAGLLSALGVRPVFAAGHSAGAAILARMALDGAVAPQGLVALNGAMLPLRRAPAHVFSPLAKLLVSVPMVPSLFARRAADRSVIERLLRNTGSHLDEAGVAYYARLASQPGHVAGALGMMANWDLRALQRDLPRLAVPLTLVVGAKDGSIPPAEARRVRTLLPSAQLITLPGLGHLAHEEQPAETVALILRLAHAAGVLSDTGAAP
jgi:magnesium chelatase accessory protein